MHEMRKLPSLEMTFVGVCRHVFFFRNLNSS